MKLKTFAGKGAALIVLVSMIAVVNGEWYKYTIEGRYLKKLDQYGEDYIDSALERATVAFGLAKTTNAVVSMLQDSEIAVSPAGLGLTLAVGELLDPLNDMVERFSWVMVASMVSLGVQKVFIRTVSWLSGSVFITAGLLVLLVSLFIHNIGTYDIRSLGVKLMLLAVLMRVAIPAGAFLAKEIRERVLLNEYSGAMKEIESGIDSLNPNEITAELENIDIRSSEEEDSGWFSTFKTVGKAVLYPGFAVKSIASSVQTSVVEPLKRKVKRFIDRFIDLMVIFVVETILIPIALAYGALRVCGYVFGYDAVHPLQKALAERVGGKSIPAG